MSLSLNSRLHRPEPDEEWEAACEPCDVGGVSDLLGFLPFFLSLLPPLLLPSVASQGAGAVETP